MKKILSIILLVIVFSLSGCYDNEIEAATNGRFDSCVATSISDNPFKSVLVYTCDEIEMTQEEYDRATDDYYTQEEIDELLNEQYMEIMELLLEHYVQTYDGKLYTNCRIEASIKVCDEITLDYIKE